MPDQILNYTIEQTIGEGTMGVVYLACNRSINQKVAIKALHPRFGNNKILRERFRHEAMLLSSLNHPNIVKFLNYVENEKGVFLIMEYVEGTTLEDYVLKKNGLLVESRAYPIMKQILGAFDYAHGRGIVHRDIKPSNIFINKEGQVKILDFGIAQILKDAGEDNMKGAGTYAYMSPEQVMENNVDTRSDIYSLGVVYSEMLTARRPFDLSLSQFEVCENILKSPLPRMKDVYPYISDGVQAIVDKATDKNPDLRYGSCREMLDDLDELYYPNGKKNGRQRGILFGVLGAILIVAAAFAAYFYFSNREMTKYYTSFAYVNGLPQGVGEIDKQEAARHDRVYKMDYAKGRLLEMSIVDGKGKLIAPADSMMRPRTFSKMDFYYDTKTGQPAYCKVYNSDGDLILKMNYGQGMLSADYEFDAATQRPDSVMGAFYQYDGQTGRLSNIAFKNEKGKPTADIDGVYGSNLEYDAEGRLAKVSFLDADKKIADNLYGVAIVNIKYDAVGVPKIEYLDKDGKYVKPTRPEAPAPYAPKAKSAKKKQTITTAPKKKSESNKSPSGPDAGFRDGYPGTQGFKKQPSGTYQQSNGKQGDPN